MKKYFYLVAVLITLSSCGLLDNSPVKKIINLTKKVEIEENNPIDLKPSNILSEINLEPSDKKIYNIFKGGPSARPLVDAASKIIYFIDKSSNITAYDIEQEKILWKNDYSLKTLSNKSSTHLSGGGMVLHRNHLYVTNGSRFLLIIDSAIGSEIGRIELEDISRSAPTLSKNGSLLVQTISNHLAVYDVRADVIPKIKWKHEGLFEILSSSKYTSPMVYDDKVIVFYSSGQIFTLDETSGKILWGINIADSLNDIITPGLDSSMVTATPIMDENFVYVAGSNSKLLKIDFNNGKVIWQKNIEDVQTMNIIGDNIFLVNNRQQVFAMEKNTGVIKWASELVFDKKNSKNKSRSFFKPFVTKNDNGWQLNIPASSAQIYVFKAAGGVIENTPSIFPIVRDAQYMELLNGELFLSGAGGIQIIN